MEEPFVRSFRYGPNGEAQVFDRAEDVPAGWGDHPSKVMPAAAVKQSGRRAGRAELMSALRRRGIQFPSNAGGAELAALLAASEPQPVAVDSGGKALGVNVAGAGEGFFEIGDPPADDIEPPEQPAPLESNEQMLPAPESLAGITELRAAYRKRFGKNPGPRWDEATLREKLAGPE